MSSRSSLPAWSLVVCQSFSSWTQGRSHKAQVNQRIFESFPLFLFQCAPSSWLNSRLQNSVISHRAHLHSQQHFDFHIAIRCRSYWDYESYWRFPFPSVRRFYHVCVILDFWLGLSYLERSCRLHLLACAASHWTSVTYQIESVFLPSVAYFPQLNLMECWPESQFQ